METRTNPADLIPAAVREPGCPRQSVTLMVVSAAAPSIKKIYTATGILEREPLKDT